MSKPWLSKLAFALAFLAGLLVAQPAKTPVLVELFTSEGCSSCPPADNLLSRLDRGFPYGESRPRAGMISSDIEVITLGEHVDYWDHDGWKDSFSSPLFSARQQDYGRAFRLQSVYTPQIVVNGRAETTGSDVRAVQEAISRVAKEPHALVGIMNTGQSVKVAVAGLPPGTRESDILLAIAESGLVTNVGGGENSGRQLRHVAVVRSLTSLGRLDPKKSGEYSAEARLNLKPEWNQQNLKLVLFVQERSTKRIIGAASAKF